MFGWKKEYGLLNKMLDDAIAGGLEETVFDESELSRLQTKLARYLSTSSISAKKTAQEKEALKELVTDIAHQTRTPLTNIIMYAELLNEQALDGAAGKYAAEIAFQAGKLDGLIQALIKMSRLETGVFQYDIKRQKLSDLVADVTELGRVKAEEKGISLAVGAIRDETAAFDRKWTAEAAYNILDNAVKYAEPGTVASVEAFSYELFAGIRISDEGPGIEEEEIPGIFGRFYRGKGVRDKEGIGVGLYLAREIIEGQGGYIKVRSKRGQGSVFEIFLPI